MSTPLNDPTKTSKAGYPRFSRSKRAVLIVFLVWLAQALPKWYIAITADGELSARIMKVFVTPRTIGS